MVDEARERLELVLGGGEDVVDLADEELDLGDELDEALGDEHDAEVLALLGADDDRLRRSGR